MSKEIYGQFLLSSQINYTCTYLADHLETITHDNVSYFLRTSNLSPAHLWKHVRSKIALSANGYIIFDDTVLAKIYSKKIAMMVCNRLKVFSYQAQQSVDAIKKELLDEYMVKQLTNPFYKFA